MHKKIKAVSMSAVFLLAAVMMFAGGKQEVPAETEPQVPTALRFPMVYLDVMESPWNNSMEQALRVIKAEKPHGLDISWETVENAGFVDIERILREFAVSGKYEIIWAHSTYADAVERLNEEFPDILWVITGGGNRYVADNVYWLEMYYHEATYLMGIIAGMMTETDIIGAVGGFPYPNVNLTINGFFEGAQSVNPNLKFKVSFIESWFDPPKAKEAALAQISAGADLIFAERYGVFEGAKEKGVLAFGHALDQNELAPDVVITSSLANWEPYLRYIIDEWWNWKTTGVKYKSPKEQPVYFLLNNGGPDIAPYHGFEDKLPQEVIDAVAEARQKIIDGDLVVPIIEEPPRAQ